MHKEKKRRDGKKKKKVVLDKIKLDDFIKNMETVRDYKIPTEWNEKLKLDPTKQHILKVKGATLNDHLQCQKLGQMPGLLFAYINKCVENKESVTAEAIIKLMTENKMGENTIFEIALFSRNVVEPKFTLEETIGISEKLPEFVNEVAKFSLGITAIG